MEQQAQCEHCSAACKCCGAQLSQVPTEQHRRDKFGRHAWLGLHWTLLNGIVDVLVSSSACTAPCWTAVLRFISAPYVPCDAQQGSEASCHRPPWHMLSATNTSTKRRTVYRACCRTPEQQALQEYPHHLLSLKQLTPACRTSAQWAWSLVTGFPAGPPFALPAPLWLGLTCCALPAEQAAPKCWARGFGGHRGHAAAHHCAWDRLQPGICAGEHVRPGCIICHFREALSPVCHPHVHKMCSLWSCLPKILFRPSRPACLAQGLL